MLTKEDLELVYGHNRLMETERLILRPVSLADAKDMYEYASDEETTRFVFPKHQSLSDTEASIIQYFINDPVGKFAIELKTTNKMIGTIDLRMAKEHPRAELGYTLNRDYWGQGYAPEAAEKLVAFGFNMLQLARIQAVHDEQNPKSGRVMEKIGMTKEGLLRNYMLVKDELSSVVMYGMTKEDYERQEGE